MSELVVSSSVSVTGAASSSVLELAGVALGAAVVGAGVLIAAARRVSQEDLKVVPADVEARIRAEAERTRRRLLATLPAQLFESAAKRSVALDPARASRLTFGLARAHAAEAALRSNLALGLIAERHDSRALSTALESLRGADAALSGGQLEVAATEAQRAECELARVAHEAYERLAVAHETQVSNTVASTLRSMGYAVERASTGAGTGIWARNGERAVGVGVLRDGRLMVDMAGFAGGSCEREASRLFRTLREHGIDTRREATILHRRRTGGQLIQAARRAGGRPEDLARMAAGIQTSRQGSLTSARGHATDGRDAEAARRAAATWLWAEVGAR
ncbi:MAG: hypothetical protein FJW96_03245 [Actinobacteria bacterium]|nr:hypothetical protein [Actinomycetota bacterium]